MVAPATFEYWEKSKNKGRRRSVSRSEIIVDSFAGGGGASLGIQLGCGRSPNIAINHDAHAIAMHAVNHPGTKHYAEDVWKADPRKVTKGQPVGLLWASPDCKHFSRAKGGKPVEKKIRSLAWVVIKWAAEVSPRVIILENVREFADWGPLVPRWECQSCDWRGTEGQAVLVRTCRRCPRCESRALRETADLVPDPSRKGLTFRRWIGRLKNLGYAVEWRNMNAADFGAPTHRRRLFLIARRDGKPITWPEATHGDPKKLDDMPLFGRLEPWRTAAECIDWTIPCPSIFDRKKPLAEKTNRRIAMGIVRYVLENPKPFIIRYNSEKVANEFRGQTTDEAFSTIDTQNRFGIVSPTVIGVGGATYAAKPRPDEPFGTVLTNDRRAVVTPIVVGVGGRMGQTQPSPVDAPSNTITAKNDRAVVTPFVVKCNHGGDEFRGQTLDGPMATVTGRHGAAIISPTIIQTGYGEREGQSPRVPGIDKPLGSVVAGGAKHALVTAFLAQHFGGMVGKTPDVPLPTITATDHNALVAANLIKFRGDSAGGSVDDPMPTITSGAGAKRPAGAAHAMGVMAANLIHLNHGGKQWSGMDEPNRTILSSGQHAALVYSFLVRYFGTAIGQHVTEPLFTITGKDRFGLVTVVVDGELYIVVDIGMRMLTPRELARAQGFPDSYQLTGTKSQQVARIGNSVCPTMAKALVSANYHPA